MYLKCKCGNRFESDQIEKCPICHRIPKRISKSTKYKSIEKQEEPYPAYNCYTHFSLRSMAKHF